MNLKPIEILYKGYRFRSRLEARWAVFFDEMCWNWLYEDQGFSLSLGPYLPDFYLPSKRMFVEVKPEQLEPDQLQRAYDLASALSNEARQDVFVVFGDPKNVIDGSNYTWCMPREHIEPRHLFDDRCEEVLNAGALAARQARFEHGQNGARA